MRRADITVGAEVYHAAGQRWQIVRPTRAVVVDPGPYRIIHTRAGAAYLVHWVRDDAGAAVLVDLDEGHRIRRTAVPARELRGLWAETLAATGRTAAGVKAQRAALHAVASSGRPVTGADLLGLAATDTAVSDDTFVALREALDGD